MGRMRSRNASSTVHTYVAAFVLAVLLAGTVFGGIFVYGKQQSARSIDPDTLCPREPLPARIAILIDASDPLTLRQQERLAGELESVMDSMYKHEWLGIYVLDEQQHSVPSPVIGKCHPGGADDANPLYQNPRQHERALQRNFIQPLDILLKQVAAVQDEQSTSPLLEMILGVSIDTGWQSGTKGKFIIVSDMLHNTPEYSHYRGEPVFTDFRNLQYAEQFLDLNLANVEIEILHVRRPRDAQHHTRRYIAFWEEYFEAVGGRLKRVKAL